MVAERKKTLFTVDENLCIGCGLCVKACPMKILEVADGLCVMTDITRCLECGTCKRDCPENAISIEEGTEAYEAGDGATPLRNFEFTPILPALEEQLKELNPQQVFTFHGIDIRSLHDFKLDGQLCFTRAYSAPKLEKIGVSSMNFYSTMRADVIVITPGPEYDIPYYVIDWDESEDHIFFICDLIPSDDPVRDPDYLQKYLYEPLEDMYYDYRSIPGLTGSVFHWVRAIHSPYLLTGTVEKHNTKNVDMLFKCANDYLKAWLNLYRKAQPQDPSSPRMQLLQQRRTSIRALYKENDPGVGALNKFLGDELAEASLTIIEP